MDWMNGQTTNSAYSPRGSARNPTMNRYLPCCIAAPSPLLVLVVLDRRVLRGRVGVALDLLDGLRRGEPSGHHLAEARDTDLLLLELDVPVLQPRVHHVVAGLLQRGHTGLEARGEGDAVGAAVVGGQGLHLGREV